MYTILSSAFFFYFPPLMHVEIGPNCSCSSFALNVYLFDIISCKQEKEIKGFRFINFKTFGMAP